MNVAKPKRVSRSYTQRLVAEPARVFPLLCPVREADWIEGWAPELVLTESGVAELECSFVTPLPRPTFWMITRHERDAGLVEMVRFTPGVSWDLLGSSSSIRRRRAVRAISRAPSPWLRC